MGNYFLSCFDKYLDVHIPKKTPKKIMQIIPSVYCTLQDQVQVTPLMSILAVILNKMGVILYESQYMQAYMV